MLLRVTAAWANDDAMRAAIERLPDRLETAADLDWSPALDVLAAADSLITIGRGPTLAIAREAALKLKETCNLQAEPFSSAEFQHGPMALVSERLSDADVHADRRGRGKREGAGGRSCGAKGAALFSTEDDVPGRLPTLKPDHADADAVCLIQSFYALAIRVAARRGTDVDRPRHLQKVTRTR